MDSGTLRFEVGEVVDVEIESMWTDPPAIVYDRGQILLKMKDMDGFLIRFIGHNAFREALYHSSAMSKVSESESMMWKLENADWRNSNE